MINSPDSLTFLSGHVCKHLGSGAWGQAIYTYTQHTVYGRLEVFQADTARYYPSICFPIPGEVERDT